MVYLTCYVVQNAAEVPILNTACMSRDWESYSKPLPLCLTQRNNMITYS